MVLDEVNLRMHRWVGIRPAPVEVDARERAPRVANHDSIRIEHWQELDYVVAEDTIVLIAIFRDLMHQMLHDQRAMSLCRMQPRLNVNDCLFLVLY